MIEIIASTLEKHQLNLSEEVVQAIATDIANALEDDKHSLWSKEAAGFLEEVVEILKRDKASIKEDTLEKIELGNLIYKIEELLIKN